MRKKDLIIGIDPDVGESGIKMQRRENLIGVRFGRLTVLNAGVKRTKSRGMYWSCRCDCGTIKEVSAQALKKGATTSCGCFQREAARRNIKHGENRKAGKTLTYKTWDKMMSRCYNENAREYKFYGGRGIKVFIPWHDYRNFIGDMGERPSKNHSIERLDVNGDYCPENCTWETVKRQANNTRRNVYFEYNGKRKTISELADIAKISYDTMYSRLCVFGWNLNNAMTVPVSRFNTRRKNYKKEL